MEKKRPSTSEDGDRTSKTGRFAEQKSYTNNDGNPPERIIFDIKSVIADTMYTLGDVRPRADSIDLMGNIVKNQMNILLIEAEKNMNLRGGKDISHKDILFLLRKNRVKLKRLLKYLRSLDNQEQSDKLGQKPDDGCPDVKKSKRKGKQIKKCMKFLSIIQDLKEFTSVLRDKSIIDHQAVNRNKRIESMKQTMTEEERIDYSEKKSLVTFCQDKIGFKQWLLKTNATRENLTALAIRIMYYFLCETVAELVDQVLLIRSKKNVQSQASSSNDSCLSNTRKRTNFDLSQNTVSDKAESLVFVDHNVDENSVHDSNPENYDEFAILPEEIMDAYAWFQEPSPITKFFGACTYGDKKVTRLICLADYEICDM